MNENIQKLLNDRYLAEGEKTWEDFIKRVSGIYPDIYQYMLDAKFMASTPTLMNYGVKGIKGTLSSCFILDVEDNFKSIFDAVRDAAEVTRQKGGVGLNFSKLRGSNEYVKGIGSTSGGPVSFILIFDSTLEGVKQGARRGAGMCQLDIHHPDILNFIYAKSKHDKFTRFNFSVRVSDKFYAQLKKSPDSPHMVKNIVDGMEHPLLDEEGKEVTTKGLWDTIIKLNYENAEPGIFNYDTATRQCTVTNVSKEVSSNPCLRDSVTVLTPDAMKKLKDIKIGDSIWSSEGWTKVINKWKTGIKEVFQYPTTAGIFESTYNHEVMSEGSKIQIQDADSIDTLQGEYKKRMRDLSPLVMDGLVLGDGSVHKASNDLVYLCIGEKDTDYFKSEVGPFILRDRTVGLRDGWEIATTITSKDLVKTYNRKIPERYLGISRDGMYAFLKGLYSANGSICGGRVTYKAASFQMILDIQLILSSLGIKSYYTTNKSKKVVFKNGEYRCKQSYDLNITGDKDKFFESIGFLQNYKTKKLKAIIDARQTKPKGKSTYKIIDTESIGYHDVYDITVDNKSHTFWCNGFDISNCAEFCNISYMSCSLASINLSLLVKDGKFDWDEYEDIIVKGTNFLNNVIEKNNFPLKKIKEVTEATMPIGLGTMGLAHMFFKLGIPYNSKKAIKLADELYNYQTLRSMKQSIELAKTVRSCYPSDKVSDKVYDRLGAYDAFDYDTYMEANERFFTKDKCREIDIVKLKKDIKKYGIRNSCQTSQAPTGCIHEDTRIKTRKGLIKIKDLLEDKPGVKEFSYDIKKESIKVFDEYKEKEVVSFYNNGVVEGYSIELEDGRNLKMSDTHRIRILSSEGDYIWRSAPELEEDDIIVSLVDNVNDVGEIQKLNIEKLSRHPKASECCLPKYLNEEVAEFIGFFTGDGSLKFRSENGKYDAIRFPVYGGDIDLIAYFENKFKNLFKLNCTASQHKDKNMYAHSINMCNWLVTNGFSKKDNKTEVSNCKNHSYNVPELIFRSPKNIVASYLRGLFEADGSVSNSIHNRLTISLSSKYKHFLQEIQELLLLFGIRSFIRETDRSGDNRSFNDIMYSLTLRSKKSKILFNDLISFISVRKKGAIKKKLNSLLWDYERVYVNKNLIIDARKNVRSKFNSTCSMYSRLTQIVGKRTKDNVSIIARSTLDDLIRGNFIDSAKYFPFSPNVYSTDKIKKITREEFNTYDIEVDDPNHTYITSNGIINHNTISILCDTSSGMEPVFSLSYMREVEKSGPAFNEKYKMYISDPVFEDYLNTLDPEVKEGILDYVADHEGSVQGCSMVPEDMQKIFITARDMTSMEHIDMLACVARNTSLSVSKTINLPKKATEEEISEVFIEAHKRNVIGVTVYRDGSRAGNLVHSEKKEDDAIIEREAPKRPDKLPCHIYRITVKGEKWVVFIGLYKGRPYEVFAGKVGTSTVPKSIEEGIISKVKKGIYQFEYDDEVLIGDIIDIFETKEQEALTRMISTNLRHGTPIKYVNDQLAKAYGTIADFSKAILRAFKRYLKDEVLDDYCELCGAKLIRTDGCIQCSQCYWSKCG